MKFQPNTTMVTKLFMIVAVTAAVPTPGCGDKENQTAVMLNVRTKMAVPADFDSMELKVFDARTGKLLGTKTRKPKSSDATKAYRRVWSVAVVAGSPTMYPEGIDMLVIGTKSGQKVAAAAARKIFNMGSVVYQTVNLDKGESPPVILSTTPRDGAKNVDRMTRIEVRFDQEMAQGPAGISGSITLQGSDKKFVSGSTTVNADTLVFEPSSLLAKNTKYTAVFRARNSNDSPYIVSAKDNSTAPAYSHTWSFETGDNLTIVSTSPANGDQDVAPDSTIRVKFDREIDPSSIGPDSIGVVWDENQVQGQVSLEKGDTLTFVPASNLPELQVVTVTVSKSVTAKNGTQMASDYEFSFTTAGVAPTVLSTTPKDGATNVSPSTTIEIVFSETMDKVSLQTALQVVEVGGGGVTGEISFDETDQFTLAFRPSSPLGENRVVEVTVDSNARDLSGINMKEDYRFSFTVGQGPAVISTDPPDGAADVPLQYTLYVDFDRAMNGSTINQDSFLLTCADEPVAGTVSYSAPQNRASFEPTEPFQENVECEATLTAEITDTNGFPLISDYVWHFTTKKIPPRVVSTTPGNGALDVNLDLGEVKIAFSEKLDPDTITSSTIMVGDHGSSKSLPPYLDANGETVTLRFSKNLEPGRIYFIEVSKEVKDLNGIPLAIPYIGYFVTRAKPGITYFEPGTFIAGVPNSSKVSVGFASQMESTSFQVTQDQGSLKSITILDGTGNLVDGIASYYSSARALQLDIPKSGNMEPNQRYSIFLDGEQLKDDQGASYYRLDGFTFVASDKKDQIPPELLETSPHDGATSVPLDENILIFFSEPLEPITVNNSNIYLSKDDSAVATDVTYLGHGAVSVSASHGLEPGKHYVLNIEKVRDLCGNMMAGEKAITFSTIDEDTSPPMVSWVVPLPNAQQVPTNHKVEVLFDEPVVGSSVRMIAKTGDAEIPTVVKMGLTNTTAILAPQDAWPAGKQITVFLEPGVEDIDGNETKDELTVTFFSVGSSPGGEQPTLLSTTPDNGADDVEPNTVVSFTLSNDYPIDLSTITIMNGLGFEFVKESTNSAIPFMVSLDPSSNKFEVKPLVLLEAGEKYSVKLPDTVANLLGNGVYDPDGKNPLEFTVETVPPEVTETKPADNGSMGAGEPLAVYFSEPMDPDTIDSKSIIIWKQGDSMKDAVPSAVGYSEDKLLALLQPAVPLGLGTYNVLVFDSVTDLAGNKIVSNVQQGYQWTVRVGTTGLWVVDASPANDDVLGPDDFDRSLVVTFNKALDQSTIADNFQVTDSNGTVQGETSYDSVDFTIIFTPDPSWDFGQDYTVHIKTGLKAKDGDAMESDFESTFHTVRLFFFDDMEGSGANWKPLDIDKDYLNTWSRIQDNDGNGKATTVWAAHSKENDARYDRQCKNDPENEKVDLESRNITVPFDTRRLFLRYRQRYDIAGVDHAQVLARTQGQIIPFSLVSEFRGKQDDYALKEVQFDIPSGIVSDFTFSLLFRLYVRGQRPGFCNPTGLGWRVDDVMVYGY